MATEISTLLANIDVYQFLKIYQMNGYTRQLSDASEMWSACKKLTEMDAMARSVKYLLIDELGYAAVQALKADGSGTYPAASRSSLQEPEALYKEWGWTVDVPRVLENKTGSELMQYAKPLATELDNKQIAFARLKSIELQGDGTGVIGVVSATPTASGGNGVFTISATSANAGRSFIRWFQEGDHIRFFTSAGADHNDVNGGTATAYWKVESVDEANNQITCSAWSTASPAVQITVSTFSGADAASGDYIYRKGTTGTNDISSIATTVDYAKLSEVMCGLETLTANDGRKVHGVNMTGSIKGTRKDLNAAVLDSKHFQQLLSELKRKAGKGRYKYNSAYMADETYDSLVESRETDRRFHSIEDSDRGVKGIGYVHGRDRVEFVPDEFCHTQRIWVLPEGKDALCYIGKDAQQVKPNGNDPFHLSVSSSGYGRSMETFFEQAGVLISKHPRALGVIEDFTVSS